MGKRYKTPEPPPTGWPAGLLQDDNRALSVWLASRLGARRVVRKVCQEIEQQRGQQ